MPSSFRKALTIARFTLLEAVRTRLLAVVVILLVLLFLGSLFILGDGVDAERLAAHFSAEYPDVAAIVLPGGCGLLLRVLGAWPTAVRQRLLELRTRWTENKEQRTDY